MPLIKADQENKKTKCTKWKLNPQRMEKSGFVAGMQPRSLKIHGRDQDLTEHCVHSERLFRNGSPNRVLL